MYFCQEINDILSPFICWDTPGILSHKNDRHRTECARAKLLHLFCFRCAVKHVRFNNYYTERYSLFFNYCTIKLQIKHPLPVNVSNRTLPIFDIWR